LARHVRDRTAYAFLLAGTVGFLFSIDGSALPVLSPVVGYPLVVLSLAFGPAWFLLGLGRLRHPRRPAGRHTSLQLRGRLVVVGVVGLLTLSMMTVEAVGTRSARSLLHPARDNPTATPSKLNLSYEEVGFTTSDGLPLSGWWIPATNNVTRCTVIFLHGYADNRTQGLDVTPWLHAAGHHVLLFDFRGHGSSGGRFTTVGLDEVHDVEAAIDHVATHADAKPDCIGLFGYSMGAATALNTVKHDPRISAVVADSPFADLQNIVANSFRKFTCDAWVCLPRYPFGPLSVLAGAWIVDRDLINNVPARAARDLDRAVFLIHGLNDTIVRTHEDHERLKNAIGPAAEEWLVKDAGHVNARRVAKGEYERRILDFLDRHLV
jgi:pimeloyl-ACP methyl ester carboxylesterase